MVLSLGIRRGMSLGGRFRKASGGSGAGLLRDVMGFWKQLTSGGHIEEKRHSILEARLLDILSWIVMIARLLEVYSNTGPSIYECA